jgi:hypothetical protein
VAEKDPNLLTALFPIFDISKRQNRIKDISILLRRNVRETQWEVWELKNN